MLEIVFLAENGKIKPVILWLAINIKFQNFSKSFSNFYSRNSAVFTYLLYYPFTHFSIFDMYCNNNKKSS